MYEENNSFEEIMERTLARVATDVDKREGSVIYNATASTNEEMANIYILLDAVLENGYADTAEREYLILRAKERGIIPYPATHAILKGEFNMEIPIGNRFNLGDLNYVATEFISSEDGVYSYQLQCEEVGTEGNVQFGELSAIDFVDNNMTGAITELLIPAEDEEDTEDLRARYINSFSTMSFAGNQDAYKEWVGKLDGVGGVKVIPVWNGGGTVKLIIINSEYNVASDTLVSTVQEAVDPTQDGSGAGIAPIGHTVTVESCITNDISISVSCTFDAGYSWEVVKSEVESVIEEYLLSLRKAWADNDYKTGTTVRISQIEYRMLGIVGIVDVQGTSINGSTDNLILSVEEIPVLGGVTNA